MDLEQIFVSLFFLANILFCCAYVVTDMMRLRSITIIAAFCTLPYFFYQAAPMYLAIFWQLAFVVINSINLLLLYLRNRPVELDEMEQRLHKLVFHAMHPRDMQTLVRAGEWITFQRDEAIVSEGNFVNGLLSSLRVSAA